MTTSTEGEAAPLIRSLLSGLEAQEVVLPAQPPRYAPLPPGLHPHLRSRLEEMGIGQLFQHQAEAAASLMMGTDTILVTGTSSGKTLAYSLPAFQALLKEPMARALFIYPTKALAQDQLGKLQELGGDALSCAVYDGDTPKSHRSAIRSHAQVVITNPDMLHLGILPSHELWRSFLRSLRVIVLDEAHTLRGVFGSHVAWVLRRLLRLCEWHGARPLVAASSATVPNPQELFERLTGRTPHVVAEDAAPKAHRTLFLVSLPLKEEEDGPTPNSLTARLLAGLARHDLRSLAFCRSRGGAELIVRYGRKMLGQQGGDDAWLDSYRGGYTPKERRSIEKAFFGGKLRGLASTNAMELGVDVGGLDAVLINGYPGSRSSFWQQAGRTGRSGRPGAIVYIPHEDALEHHLLRKPELLFSGAEPVVTSPGNSVIASAQLQCAAFERPMAQDEPPLLWPGSEAPVAALVEQGSLSPAAGRYFFAGRESPASQISIRGASTGKVQLVADGEEVGEMEDWRALRDAFPGAVYLHRDKTFLVDRLDWQAKTAFLRADSPDHYTTPLVQTVAEEKARLKESRLPDGAVGLALLEVTTRTTGFRRVSFSGGRLLDEEPLEMPSLTFSTIGVTLDISADAAPILEPRTSGIIHALEHLLAAASPLAAGCDPRDLMSAWYLVAPETFAPRVVIFDSQPGGIGLSEALFDQWPTWLAECRDIIEACPCEDGCPRCLMSSRCGSGNQPLDKAGARALLAVLLAMPA